MVVYRQEGVASYAGTSQRVDLFLPSYCFGYNTQKDIDLLEEVPLVVSVDIPKGSIQEVILTSRHLGTEERIMIYTPHRYTPLYSYPVVYIQDGDDYLSLGRLPSLLDQFSHSRETQDVIAVFIPVKKEKRTSRYHPEGEEHAQYKRFLAEEVVSYIDRHYSTHPLGHARTLLGESLGGVVSLFTALTYPHTFGQVAAQSGAFSSSLCAKVNEWEISPQLSVYMEIGTQEREVETSRGVLDLVEGNEQMREILHNKKITLRYETFEGDHTWGYWQANLPHILHHFLKK
ncbi:alpha/beta hydrolase [Brevibacillus ginsengisoli]|uniref:alpha/beta hydrolase n=1 Tax=Brevibacillus ginsengisoli TaxID=363854 RepID=UPI003CF74C64